MANLHRALVALLAAPALMVPSAGAFAQPPETPAGPPAEVCLTNACADPPAEPAKPATVRQAIRAGDSLAARALGGSPADVVAALQARVESDADAPDWARRDPESLERYRAHEREDFAHLANAALGGFRFVDQVESLIPFKGGGLPKPGGAGDIAFILERRTASGCLEMIIVQDDGRGVPSANKCTR